MSVPNNTFTPYQSSLVQQWGLPSYSYQPNSDMVRLGWNSPYIRASAGNVGTGITTPNVPTITTPEPINSQFSMAQAEANWRNNNGTIQTNSNGQQVKVVDTTNPPPAYDPATASAGTSSGSLFGYGKNADGQTVWGGATGAQWAGLGLQTAFGAFNAYQSYKAQKLAREQWEDQKRLNHANYQNQAKSFNNSMRNQMSGRGYIGMTSQAKQTLGKEYNTRKAKEDY